MMVRWYQVGAFSPFFRAHGHIGELHAKCSSGSCPLTLSQTPSAESPTSSTSPTKDIFETLFAFATLFFLLSTPLSTRPASTARLSSGALDQAFRFPASC
jgi:hypothetical protein